jgi:hypothetical protein
MPIAAVLLLSLLSLLTACLGVAAALQLRESARAIAAGRASLNAPTGALRGAAKFGGWHSEQQESGLQPDRRRTPLHSRLIWRISICTA